MGKEVIPGFNLRHRYYSKLLYQVYIKVMSKSQLEKFDQSWITYILFYNRFLKYYSQFLVEISLVKLEMGWSLVRSIVKRG